MRSSGKSGRGFRSSIPCRRYYARFIRAALAKGGSGEGPFRDSGIAAHSSEAAYFNHNSRIVFAIM